MLKHSPSSTASTAAPPATAARSAKVAAPQHALQAQCSITRASALVGDAWSLKILRELFWGYTRFEQLAQRTGAASNVLAARLKKLGNAGIVERSVVEGDARRFDYVLTEKGRALFPVLMSLMAWGDAWASGDRGPLVTLRHVRCGQATQAGAACTHCGEPLSAAEVRGRLSDAYRVGAQSC